MKIYVSNLAVDITDEEIRMLFECFGQVASVEMRRSPGSALVDMPDKTAAREAITGLHGQSLRGYELMVSEAKKRTGGNSRHRGRRPHRRRRR